MPTSYAKYRLSRVISLLFLLVMVDHVSPTPAYSNDPNVPEFVAFFGDNTRFRGNPVPIDAVIRAFDPQDNECGSFIVQDPPGAGSFGPLQCQGDDPATPNVDEGPLAGEAVTFTINNLPATVVPLRLNGLPAAPDVLPPDTPVVWTGNLQIWEILLIVPEADVSVTIDVNDTAPPVLANVAFTVTANNAGPDPATGVVVASRLPDDLAFVGSAPSQGSFDPATGLWTVGTIPVAGNATLVITAQVTERAVEFENLNGSTAEAELIAAQEIDPDSVPNNNILAEDDQDRVTIFPVGRFSRPVGGHSVRPDIVGQFGWMLVIGLIVMASAGISASRRTGGGRLL